MFWSALIAMLTGFLTLGSKKTQALPPAPKVSIPAPAAPQQNNLDVLFQRYGQIYGISPALLKAIATVESGLNPSAKNPTSSAKGLMQVVDGTARDMGESPASQYDAETSIRTGAKYLNWLMRTYSFDVYTAIRAYYAGAGTIIDGDRGRTFKLSWQPDAYAYSRTYLSKVLNNYQVYV